MAKADVVASEPPPPNHPLPSALSGTHGFFRKLFGRQNGRKSPSIPVEQPTDSEPENDSADPDKAGLIRRMSRRVVPGLPRAQTFKRQVSERRTNLTPIEPTPDERRAVSMDRRSYGPRASSTSQPIHNPRVSAPSFLGSPQDEAPRFVPSLPVSPVEDEPSQGPVESALHKDDEATLADECPIQDSLSNADTHSITASQYDAIIHEELEKMWILNLSMHFRDRSRREKFFVTYREQEHLWRRVTISLDYRDAPPNSLEMDLIHTHYQRDKSAKIYEAIRESLRDIQFYDTVTNLKLQTTDGRLHVHVVEDGNEIIQYPTVAQIKHLGCRRVREKDIVFDSHMSGFVYKVNVNGHTLIKKEIPSPDTIDEFLYEVNALNCLRYSRNVIHFYGVVVDDHDEHVKGLLIDYAEQGALIDIIYEHCKDGDYNLPWSTREKWARQIVEGLSDIHESGFVQGDFTLSNIVIDEYGDAKIIDINRRGCPVGWEPPEATPLIEGNQRISMYIGVKSDLYQLGMVLWALATQEDEPEAQGRPLILGPEVNIPDWYRQMAEVCLSDDPRMRLQASALLQMFPQPGEVKDCGQLNPPQSSIDEGYTLQQYLVDGYHPDNLPQIRTVEPPVDWSYVTRPYTDASPIGYEPYYYTRGRSPPSPLPSNYDGCDSPRGLYDIDAWAANRNIPSSYSDVGPDGMPLDETPVADKPELVESDAPTVANSTTEKRETPATSTSVSSPLGDVDIMDTPKGRIAASIIEADISPRRESCCDEGGPEPLASHDDAVTGLKETPAPENVTPEANSPEVHTPRDVITEDEAVGKANSLSSTVALEGVTRSTGIEEIGEAQALESNAHEDLTDVIKIVDGSNEAQPAPEGQKPEIPEVLPKKSSGVPENTTTKAEPEVKQNAEERQEGITAPYAHQTKADRCIENKELTVKEGGISAERGITGSDMKNATYLVGIGAALGTTHDRDTTRQKATIDDGFRAVNAGSFP
ncbi:serine threonine kinase [Fusarium albosuccineum]|uniref:Serine threonine kinase n=1 Tax=Fusarium albosuccineum TaxID=1237068 RepID=A0A8H4L5R9_9HYPO|nr:serine threonine kinase [Fusarium albosuccineum]